MSLKDHFDLVILDWGGTMIDFGCEAPVSGASLDVPATTGGVGNWS